MQSIEIRLPRFFVDEFVRKRNYRNQMIDKLLMQFHDTNMPEEEELVDDKFSLVTIDKAVHYIQKIERGRQGIDRAYLAKQLRKMDYRKSEKHRRLQEGTEIAEETERDDAILIIQKYYRGFKGREEIFRRRKEEMVFLGFEKDEKISQHQHQKEKEKREQSKKLQIEHQKDYVQALKDAKEQLLQNWSEDMKDNMLKERRDWYWSEVAKAEGKFVPPKADQFYKKDNVRLPLNDEEMELLDLQDKERKAKKKDKGKKKKKKKKGEQDEEKREQQGPTEAVISIQNQIEAYTNQWDKKDEHQNFLQKHDPSLLNDEVTEEAEKQVRKMVDQMIDMELVNLRVSLKAKKHKYPKDPDEKKGGKKRGRKGKKSKKGSMPKPETDDGEIIFQFRSPKKKKKKKFPGEKLTNKKDPRDMLAELIEAGIVKKLMPARIDELIGDPYPLRYKQEMLQEKVADPSMFDLRQVITQFVGMPLGSNYVKDNVKETNYILFYGPNGSGKTHMVRALQTECNAIIIDLSPSNIETKYVDKPDYMLNLSFKVAAYFQPAIIYIDEVEKIFKGKKKKKKKGAAFQGPPEVNYTKLRKFLLKFNKFYTEKEPENVAIIGCSSQPWDANKKQLKTFFKKRIYFPCPNYATRLQLFQHFFQQKNVQLNPNFPLNSLAHVTEGFTAGNIKTSLDKVLSERRVLLASEIPYRVNEFLQPLSNQQSTFLSVYLKFRDLHDEFSGNKARIEKRNNPGGDDPKAKKKKKKK